MLTPIREKIKLEMHTYICTCFTLNEKTITVEQVYCFNSTAEKPERNVCRDIIQTGHTAPRGVQK